MFWIYALLLAIPVIVLLIKPLLFPRPLRDVNRTQLNARIYKQQVNELERDVDLGVIAPEEQANIRQDLENTLAASLEQEAPPASLTPKQRMIAITSLIVLVPAITIAAYLKTGDTNYEQLNPETAATMSMDEAVAGLEAKLNADPNNVEGWLMLGRSYEMLGKPEKTVQSFRRARAVSNNNPDITAMLAFALIRATNSFGGEPITLLHQVLQQSPNNQEALFLVGRYHFDQGENQQALALWEKLITLTSPKDSVPVQKMIDEAKSRLGIAVTEPPTPAKGGAYVVVNLDIAPALRTTIANPKQTTVFIYIQAATGPKMPLIAKKITVADLPASVRLDNTMALNPERTLNSVANLVVSARLSQSGDALATANDRVVTKTIKDLNQAIDLMLE
jgi:cytochrome c-type biogenesis protein CcmH